jgi:hypothetical protein
MKDHTSLRLKLLNSSYIATTQSGSRSASSTLKGSKEETNEQCSQKFVTRDLVVTPFLISPSMLSTGDLFEHFDTLLDMMVLLLYPHHPHLPLDHCSLLDRDYLVQYLLHDYIDQDIMQVEWYHLERFLEIDYLDLMVLHHQSPFFVEHHMGLPHHLQD